MNANELTDWIKNTEFYNNSDTNINDRMDEVEAMLRQQQAKIEALKKEAALQRLSDFTQEAESFDRTASYMAGEYVSCNEPVAWTDGKGNYFDKNSFFPVDDLISLYTHPAKILTDEEILTAIKCIANDVSPHKEYENTYEDGWLDACNTVYDEVFAILKKASEK